MPSARQASRFDGSGVRQEGGTQGNSKTDSFTFSPRLTWKSGNDNLNLASLVHRSYWRGTNYFERSREADAMLGMASIACALPGAPGFRLRCIQATTLAR
jgi:hypothetical protein